MLWQWPRSSNSRVSAGIRARHCTCARFTFSDGTVKFWGWNFTCNGQLGTNAAPYEYGSARAYRDEAHEQI